MRSKLSEVWREHGNKMTQEKSGWSDQNEQHLKILRDPEEEVYGLEPYKSLVLLFVLRSL
jgi:hypothetical protein